MKNEYKIRKWLGNKYHLYVSLSGNKLENTEWKLFRKYPGYLKDGSKAIMTSETHSEKELYKFAKKHRYFNPEKVILKIVQFFACIGLVMSINNYYSENDSYRMFFLGFETVIITISIIMFFVYCHNTSVDKLELTELFKELKEECEKDERETNTRENN